VVAVYVHRHIGQVLDSAVSREQVAADSQFQAAAYCEHLVWADFDSAIVQHIASSFAFRLSRISFRHSGFWLSCSWAGQGSIPFTAVPSAVGSWLLVAGQRQIYIAFGQRLLLDHNTHSSQGY